MSDEGPIPTDTGLVAAAVTMSVPLPPPPEPDPVVQVAAVAAAVVPAMQMPPDWDLHKVAALVTDMAQNLYDRPYILKKHSLTEAQMQYLEGNTFYQRALEAEVLTWQGSNSIQKRLALEAAIAVEAAMPTVAARLTKATEPLADVVGLLKVLSEIAGTTGAKAQAGQTLAGERIKIVINMGDDATKTTASPSIVAIQSQSEGEGTRQALSALIQAPGSPAPLRDKP